MIATCVLLLFYVFVVLNASLESPDVYYESQVIRNEEGVVLQRDSTWAYNQKSYVVSANKAVAWFDASWVSFANRMGYWVLARFGRYDHELSGYLRFFPSDVEKETARKFFYFAKKRCNKCEGLNNPFMVADLEGMTHILMYKDYEVPLKLKSYEDSVLGAKDFARMLANRTDTVGTQQSINDIKDLIKSVCWGYVEGVPGAGLVDRLKMSSGLAKEVRRY